MTQELEKYPKQAEETRTENPDVYAVDKKDDRRMGTREFLRFMAEAFSESSERAVKALNAKSKFDNVAIFVDYDNIYWTLTNYQHHPDHEDPQKNLFFRLWELYGRDNIRVFKAYADYEQVKNDLTRLQHKRIQVRHVYANGKTENKRKNSSDIELCIDAIETTYKDPNITCFVFVTADSDMIPIMSRLMYKGKRVELFYIDSSAPKHTDITNFCHKAYNLMDFLNVEIKSISYEKYIGPGILAVQRWHEKHVNRPDVFLGKLFMKNSFISDLQLTPQHASRLVDLFIGEKLVIERHRNDKSEYVLNVEDPRVQAALALDTPEAAVTTNKYS
ncbi:NYN domain-containing protein [Brevibacillus borstelensis]|uniref:NYN domain-containing protein n=1 Tax=Brevibacillus borstelensis TaxID=45462 RepID=UPI0020A5333D|nr:NYN domain-containing protein [Brevibacillus borstelensis]